MRDGVIYKDKNTGMAVIHKNDVYTLVKQEYDNFIKIDECKDYPDVFYHIHVGERGYYSIARGNTEGKKALMKVGDNKEPILVMENAHDPLVVDDNHIQVTAEHKYMHPTNGESYWPFSVLLREEKNKLFLESMTYADNWYERDENTGKMMVFYNNTMPGEEDVPGQFESKPLHKEARQLKERVNMALEVFNEKMFVQEYIESQKSHSNNLLAYQLKKTYVK